jgi:general secretion pathway protein A
LVSGPAGVGKTTPLRSFAESLDREFFKIAYAPLATVSVIDFYRQLAHLLAGIVPYKKDLPFRTIQDTIIQLALNKKIIPIIIFDDSHFLGNENFLELQLRFFIAGPLYPGRSTSPVGEIEKACF